MPGVGERLMDDVSNGDPALEERYVVVENRSSLPAHEGVGTDVLSGSPDPLHYKSGVLNRVCFLRDHQVSITYQIHQNAPAWAIIGILLDKHLRAYRERNGRRIAFCGGVFSRILKVKKDDVYAMSGRPCVEVA